MIAIVALASNSSSEPSGADREVDAGIVQPQRRLDFRQCRHGARTQDRRHVVQKATLLLAEGRIWLPSRR